MKKGITLIETLIAVLVLGIMLIPIFGYLTGAVSDIDRIYTEAMALSRARFIMDTMLFHIPYKAIHEGEGNSCVFKGKYSPDPEGKTFREKARVNKRNQSKKEELKELNDLLTALITDNELFGNDKSGMPATSSISDHGEEVKVWVGEGLYLDAKGYYYHSIAKVIDLKDDVKIIDLQKKAGVSEANFEDIFGKKENLSIMKKIVVQVTWANKKGVMNPEELKDSKSLFLVAFKSNVD